MRTHTVTYIYIRVRMCVSIYRFPACCLLEGTDTVQSKQQWDDAVEHNQKVTKKLAEAGVVDESITPEKNEVVNTTVQKVSCAHLCIRHFFLCTCAQ